MSRPNTAYQINNSGDLNGLVLQLNSIFNQIADRLDKIEGYRETLETSAAKFSADVTVNADVFINDSDGKKIHSME